VYAQDIKVEASNVSMRAKQQINIMLRRHEQPKFVGYAGRPFDTTVPYSLLGREGGGTCSVHVFPCDMQPQNTIQSQVVTVYGGAADVLMFNCVSTRSTEYSVWNVKNLEKSGDGVTYSVSFRWNG
jgi:hypothetical protein